MATILWIIAVVLVIAGIVQLFQGQLALGIVLIIVGFLVGPGGVSIFATSWALNGLWPALLRRGVPSLEVSHARAALSAEPPDVS